MIANAAAPFGLLPMLIVAVPAAIGALALAGIGGLLRRRWQLRAYRRRRAARRAEAARFPLPEHLSLVCRLKAGHPHRPCSGTCDRSHRANELCGRLCECSCHGGNTELPSSGS